MVLGPEAEESDVPSFIISKPLKASLVAQGCLRITSLVWTLCDRESLPESQIVHGISVVRE